MPIVSNQVGAGNTNAYINQEETYPHCLDPLLFVFDDFIKLIVPFQKGVCKRLYLMLMFSLFSVYP